MKRALEEPLRLTASNAGHEGEIVIGKVRDSAKASFGFNAETEEYTDMISAGIVDPAKVTRTALDWFSLVMIGLRGGLPCSH